MFGLSTLISSFPFSPFPLPHLNLFSPSPLGRPDTQAIAIAVREFQLQVSNKMPDYLGKDQRKIKDDEKKDDKPIQGASDTLNHTKSRRDLLVTRLTSFSLRLHMETRIQIFD